MRATCVTKVSIEAVDPAARGPFAADREMRRLLVALWARARAAWPEIAISIEDFIAHLIRVAHRPGGELARVRAAEVYLALACLRGDTRAQGVFDREYLPTVDAALAQQVDQPERVQRLKRLLRVRLFRSVGGRPPEIARYTGLARLDTWLKLVATRFARRFRRTEARQRTGQALAQGPTDPTGKSLSITSRAELAEALRQAALTIGDRERHLLTLYLVNGIEVSDIARSCATRRVVAARWLERLQCRLYARTRELLLELTGSVDQRETRQVERLMQRCFLAALTQELRKGPPEHSHPSGSFRARRRKRQRN